MTISTATSSIKTACCGLLLLAAGTAFAQDAKPGSTVTAITKPSKSLKLSFGAPGVVMDVPVVEGDVVRKGEVLAQQDDRQDQAALASIKLESESTAKIDYSTIDRGVKAVQKARKDKMRADHVAAESEVEEAKLAVDLADAQVILAKVDNSQKKLEAAKQQYKIDQERIVSPIDGIVQKLNIGPGEMADPQNREGAIVVVKNNPLWAEVHLATSQALQLKVGQPMQVQYPGKSEWNPAKVIFLDPQADAASDTQLVRLEMPNPTGVPSGLQVTVKLPDAMVASNN